MEHLRIFIVGALVLGLTHSRAGIAGSEEWESWSAKFQTTYVFQRKAEFSARYTGQNSLSTAEERSYSFTTTAAFGYRPWIGGELYFDPELAQGVPLSNLTGLGGFSNGEMARVTGPTPTLYRARLFLRQTWGLGGGQEAVESDMNQLAGSVDKRRIVLTAGNLSVLDIFDGNTYSHDPRTQFLNWALMTHGAYDYAADARGYSWGVAAEYYYDDWTVRVGRFIQPREPNQLSLDPRILKHYGDQIEFERRYELRAQPGAVRVLFFRNRARMSRFDDALSLAATTGGVPDINLVRFSDHIKYGAGLNIEQQLWRDVGIFGRASWADGQTETYAFTGDRQFNLSRRGRQRRFMGARTRHHWTCIASERRYHAHDRTTSPRVEWAFSSETVHCDTDLRTSWSRITTGILQSASGGPLIFNGWSIRPITRTAACLDSVGQNALRVLGAIRLTAKSCHLTLNSGS